MEDSFIFVDAGFLSKLNNYLGGGKYIKYDLIKFCNLLCKKQNLNCKKIFYYTTPPFQSEKPTEDEIKRRENYDNFIKKISKDERLIVREGRCQRLKSQMGFEYNQKAVDPLMIIDMMSVPIKNKDMKKIILIACDSDLVPVIKELENSNIKSILYTYYQKSRDENFSTSNHLIKTVWKYLIITKQDFDNCPL